jgi:hypothetical protein
VTRGGKKSAGWFECDDWIIWRLVDLQPGDENVVLLVPGVYKRLTLLATRISPDSPKYLFSRSRGSNRATIGCCCNIAVSLKVLPRIGTHAGKGVSLVEPEQSSTAP